MADTLPKSQHTEPSLNSATLERQRLHPSVQQPHQFICVPFAFSDNDKEEGTGRQGNRTEMLDKETQINTAGTLPAMNTDERWMWMWIGTIERERERASSGAPTQDSHNIQCLPMKNLYHNGVGQGEVDVIVRTRLWWHWHRHNVSGGRGHTHHKENCTYTYLGMDFPSDGVPHTEGAW